MAIVTKTDAVTEVRVISPATYNVELTQEEAEMLISLLSKVSIGSTGLNALFNGLYAHADGRGYELMSKYDILDYNGMPIGYIKAELA